MWHKICKQEFNEMFAFFKVGINLRMDSYDVIFFFFLWFWRNSLFGCVYVGVCLRQTGSVMYFAPPYLLLYIYLSYISYLQTLSTGGATTLQTLSLAHSSFGMLSVQLHMFLLESFLQFVSRKLCAGYPLLNR